MTVSNITEQSGRIVVALTGEIDMENAPQVRRALLDNLKQKRDILVEVDGMGEVDEVTARIFDALDQTPES